MFKNEEFNTKIVDLYYLYVYIHGQHLHYLYYPYDFTIKFSACMVSKNSTLCL